MAVISKVLTLQKPSRYQINGFFMGIPQKLSYLSQHVYKRSYALSTITWTLFLHRPLSEIVMPLSGSWTPIINWFESRMPPSSANTFERHWVIWSNLSPQEITICNAICHALSHTYWEDIVLSCCGTWILKGGRNMCMWSTSTQIKGNIILCPK